MRRGEPWHLAWRAVLNCLFQLQVARKRGCKNEKLPVARKRSCESEELPVARKKSCKSEEVDDWVPAKVAKRSGPRAYGPLLRWVSYWATKASNTNCYNCCSLIQRSSPINESCEIWVWDVMSHNLCSTSLKSLINPYSRAANNIGQPYDGFQRWAVNWVRTLMLWRDIQWVKVTMMWRLIRCDVEF